VRKWLLILAVCVGLGLILLVRLAAEDARQAALLDARVREAENRFWMSHVVRRASDGATAEELRHDQQEALEAMDEYFALRAEQAQRQQSWHARLRWEVKRRTGW
jgi:hypothetical protein